jgi:hypothetical protein
MAHTLAEKEGWIRPKLPTKEVKSRFGITSDFCLSDKGYKHVAFITFFAIYRKGWKFLIQWRGKEWKRQRSEDFYRLKGCTEEEWTR